MEVVKGIEELRNKVKDWKKLGYTIGLVPTMGFLHEGHGLLIEKAKKEVDKVIVSVFVNPTQFNNASDLETYPKDLESDKNLIINKGGDLIFAPDVEEIYGQRAFTTVDTSILDENLCGATRPGHFRGVCTIVSKLFNIVMPHKAYFGKKDYQQLAVFRQMVEDLCMDIEIIGVPTVREMDGLAMSSRNNLLTLDERQRAPVLARTMRWINSTIRGGRDDYTSIIEDAVDQLRAADLEPDEIFIRDARTLLPISADSKQAVILMSAFLGKVRLIDNQVLDLSSDGKDDSEEE